MIPDFVSSGYLAHFLRPREQPQRLVVARLRAAHPRVQAADGLDVVVEDLGARREHGRERLLLDAEEVRREDLDLRRGQLPLQRPDRRGVVAGATVGEIVAVDGRDDDVGEPHLRGGLGEPERLERIGRPVGLTGVHVAVPARPRAGVSEDLERRRPAAPALADVRAARLLADRVQAALAHEPLDLEVARARARRAYLHPLGAARALGHGQRSRRGGTDGFPTSPFLHRRCPSAIAGAPAGRSPAPRLERCDFRAVVMSVAGSYGRDIVRLV